jgi:hypothetical protein
MTARLDRVDPERAGVAPGNGAPLRGRPRRVERDDEPDVPEFIPPRPR